MHFTCIIMILVYVEAKDFNVENSGIFPVEEGDLGIRFFLMIANNARESSIIVKAHEPECCWLVEPGDEDCESMKLFGGFPAKIDSGKKKNVTYVFPNIYPMDRIGSCKFHLKKIGDQAIVHEIPFNTTIQEESGSWMKQLFKGGPKIYVRCKGIDENPRNHCQPFNCAKKYNGYRSFLRVEQGKCEPVERCTTLLDDKELPTSAFDFENNRCKSLVEGIKDHEKKVMDDMIDKSPLAKERMKYEDVNPKDLVIDCKHGEQRGRYCRCKRGWKTVSVLTAGGGVKMDWCSKKVKVKQIQQKPNKFLKLILLIIILTACCCLFMLVLYLWWRLFLREIIGKNANTTDKKRIEFPQIDPFWQIGGETFNSNDSHPTKHDVGKLDASDEYSEEELFDEINNQSTSRPSTSQASRDPMESAFYKRPKSWKDQAIRVTNSDRYVLVPQMNNDPLNADVDYGDETDSTDSSQTIIDNTDEEQNF